MTNDYLYEKAIELATGMARVTTRDQVKVVTWLPFQLLYVELVKRKEITPISEMDQQGKEKYWAEVCKAQPGSAKYKKIWIWQSLFVYDLITAP